MYKLQDFFGVLDEYAPIIISKKAVERGEYDNSGIIVNSHDGAQKALFSLDLSIDAVNRAKRLGVDTIVTHHPAIYAPLSTISVDNADTAPILTAIQNEMNVISMHLNLDMADGGIDACLAQALGATSTKILEELGNGVGYGREFTIKETTLSKYLNEVRAEFHSKRIICYGNKNAVINKVASFCGSGSSHAVKAVATGSTDADLIVTSDIPHHCVKALIESKKSIIAIPHYSAEEYGFYRYYQKIQNKLGNDLILYYFKDKRFI